MGYYDFPHTRNYDGDLGYLIKVYKELKASYASIEAQYEALTKIYELVQKDIANITIEQLETWLEDGTLSNLINQSIFEELAYERVNVRSYGAKGDGVTDDTQAILDAISNLKENTTLFFPNGDYIVYNDYENNHNEYGYDYDKLIKLVGAKNICIEGEDRANTRIRPSYQHASSSKYNYPVTLSIYQCENITVKNISIESKGESFGDTDGITASDKTMKAKQMMTNGGQPLLILDCENVRVENVDGRLCGSVGIFYVTDSTHVIFTNCFANCFSLGYGGYCADTFLGVSQDKDLIVQFDNCRQWKETKYQPEDPQVAVGSPDYAGKCGIIIESNNNPYKAIINNFTCADMYGNLNDRQLGQAVISANSNLYLNGLHCRNCLGAVQFNSYETSLKLFSYITAIDAITRCLGVNIYENLNMGYERVLLTNSKIIVDGSETYPDDDFVKQSSCLSGKAYSDSTLIVKDCILESVDYVAYFPHNKNLEIYNSKMKANNGIYARSGNHIINNNVIEFSLTFGINVNTTDAQSIVNNTSFVCNNNYFKSSNNLSAIYFNNSNGNPNLIKQRLYENNVFENCYLSPESIRAGVSLQGLGTTVLVKNVETTGGNTILTLDNTRNGCYYKCAMIDNTGQIRIASSVSANKITFTGTLNSAFSSGRLYPAFKLIL